MSVSAMKKVRVFAHATRRTSVVTALQEAGIVEICEIADLPSTHRVPEDLEKRITEAARRRQRLERCLALAERFRSVPPLLHRLAQPLVPAQPELISRLRRETDVDSVHAECVRIEDELAQWSKVAEESAAKRETLEPWRSLPVAPRELEESPNVELILIAVSAHGLETLETALAEASRGYLVQVVGRSEKAVHALVGYFREDREEFHAILSSQGIRPVRLPVIDVPPSEAISQLEKDRTEAEEGLNRAREAAAAFAAEWYLQLAVLVDDATSNQAAYETERAFLYTDRTFYLEGWIREDHLPALEKILNSVGPEIHFSVSDPEPEDDVPVVLENRPTIRPVEFVMYMYGRPAYGTVDPVPYFAPFFVLFFGMCLGDAGYGLVLTVISAWILAKLRPQGGLRDIAGIGLYGGIAAFVVGVLTGGYFGISTDMLPGFLQSLILVDTVRTPMTMLYVALSLGVIQILFGLGVKFWRNMSSGKVADAILDQLLWILFIAALVPLAYDTIFGEPVSESVLGPARKIALVLAILLVLTQGRSQKNLFLRIPMGVLKMYDTVSIFGDVMSYARLLALGLATAAIASAFNGIAGLTLGLPLGLGYVAAALILLGGHTFNLAVNCLGGFVHSARLQYLEFFSKFFEGGGRVFQPLKRAEKYSIVVRPSGNEPRG